LNNARYFKELIKQADAIRPKYSYKGSEYSFDAIVDGDGDVNIMSSGGIINKDHALKFGQWLVETYGEHP